MTIALIAHDRKKELLVQFCIAYCGILSQHELCATGATGRLVAEATGLDVTCFMPGPQGGTEQLGARIAYNEIDLVILFRDPNTSAPNELGLTLVRLCDVHTIPIATNVATAEVLIHGLERGDMDWRKIAR
jgi:methylglyoxal synthase